MPNWHDNKFDFEFVVAETFADNENNFHRIFDHSFADECLDFDQLHSHTVDSITMNWMINDDVDMMMVLKLIDT